MYFEKLTAANRILPKLHFDKCATIDACDYHSDWDRECYFRNAIGFRIDRIEITADFGVVTVNSGDVLERLKKQAGSFRKRIVHDSIYIGDANIDAILCEIDRISGKRDCVLAFYHGPTNGFKKTEFGLQRFSGIEECRHCADEYDALACTEKMKSSQPFLASLLEASL